MTRWEGDDLRIEVPRVVEAHIRTVAGEVAVTATTGPAQVDAEVLAGEPVVVTLEDGVLMVAHEPARGFLGNFGARRTESVIAVSLPPGTPVTIRTVSAEVVVAGLQAGVSVNTVSASIAATDIGGDLTLRTVSGEIEAQPVKGELALNTVSGAVTVAGELSQLTGRSVSGDLTFDLDDVPQASLTTVSGDVILRVPTDASLRLDATTMSGHLDSAFPVAGVSTKRKLEGRVGDGRGAPSVDVRTVSGDVALLRRAPGEAVDMAGAVAGDTAAGDE